MSLWSRFVNVFRHDRVIDDIDEELESHLAEAVRHGRSAEDVRRALGPTLRWREASHDVRRRVWLDDVIRDVRYAVRTFARQPAFSGTAVLTLALGIGANVAIFSLIDTLMLRSLAVAEPERLVQITRSNTAGQPAGAFSYPLFQYVRDGSHVFDGMFAQNSSVTRARVEIRGGTEQADEAMVSGDYYGVLGVQPAVGRLLLPDDDAPGAEAVVVISYRYWQRRFGGDRSTIGASIVINGLPATIVGVTPPAFFGTNPGADPALTVPLSMFRVAVGGRSDMWRSSDGFNFLSVVGRLKPGATLATAAADVGTVFGGWTRAQAARAHNPNEVGRILGQ